MKKSAFKFSILSIGITACGTLGSIHAAPASKDHLTLDRKDATAKDSISTFNMRNFSSVKRSSYPGYRRGYGVRIQENASLQGYFPNALNTTEVSRVGIADAGGQFSCAHLLPYADWMNDLILGQIQVGHKIPYMSPTFSRFYGRGINPFSAAQLSLHYRHFEESFRLGANLGAAVDFNDHFMESKIHRPMSWIRLGAFCNYKKDLRFFGECQGGFEAGRKIPLDKITDSDFSQERIKDQYCQNFLQKNPINPKLTHILVSPANGIRLGFEMWALALMGVKKWGLQNLSWYSTFLFSGVGNDIYENGQSAPYFPSLPKRTSEKFKEQAQQGSGRIQRYGIDKGFRWKLSPLLKIEFGWNSLFLQGGNSLFTQMLYQIACGAPYAKISLNWASNLTKNEHFSFSPGRVRNLRAGSAERVDLCEDMNLSDRFLVWGKSEEKPLQE